LTLVLAQLGFLFESRLVLEAIIARCIEVLEDYRRKNRMNCAFYYHIGLEDE
jgi:hypothetical protein